MAEFCGGKIFGALFITGVPLIWGANPGVPFIWGATPGPKMEVAPTYLRVWDWVWVAVGRMADAPLPLLCLGRGDAAPQYLRTRATIVLLDSQRPITKCSH